MSNTKNQLNRTTYAIPFSGDTAAPTGVIKTKNKPSISAPPFTSLPSPFTPIRTTFSVPIPKFTN